MRGHFEDDPWTIKDDSWTVEHSERVSLSLSLGQFQLSFELT